MGYPSEDENPEDIAHITQYLAAEDTRASQDILNQFPVLFRDPVVLNVINLVRTFLISPPQELLPQHHAEPAYPPATSDAYTTSAPTPQELNPIFGSLLPPATPDALSALYPASLSDQKLITTLASIADGSLTHLGYDYKTHQQIIETPNIDQRMYAIKLLGELASTASNSSNNSAPVAFINDINITTPDTTHTVEGDDT